MLLCIDRAQVWYWRNLVGDLRSRLWGPVCHRERLCYSSFVILLLDGFTSYLTRAKRTTKQLVCNLLACLSHLQLYKRFLGRLQTIISERRHLHLIGFNAPKFGRLRWGLLARCFGGGISDARLFIERELFWRLLLAIEINTSLLIQFLICVNNEDFFIHLVVFRVRLVCLLTVLLEIVSRVFGNNSHTMIVIVAIRGVLLSDLEKSSRRGLLLVLVGHRVLEQNCVAPDGLCACILGKHARTQSGFHLFFLLHILTKLC